MIQIASVAFVKRGWLLWVPCSVVATIEHNSRPVSVGGITALSVEFHATLFKFKNITEFLPCQILARKSAGIDILPNFKLKLKASYGYRSFPSLKSREALGGRGL
jgi:hypothetical protein